ncbi:trans-aconitate 2-methyltransferase [Nocardioides sp.]|uniref:class I SAM-dependent methyltransferase n=1 Tax=Nocardioides sp. TaxID=35761 RepID=UPI003567F561
MIDLPFPQVRARETSWPAYYEAISGRPARALLKRLLDRAPTPGPGMLALDLGCGDGTETEALARTGWPVTAMDVTPEAVELTRGRCRAMSHVEVVQSSFADFEFPAADLVYAGLSLPFGPGAEFSDVWRRLRAALRPGGVLAMHLLGERDSWAPDASKTFVDGSALPALLRGLEVLEVRELDEDGEAFGGAKHWHVFEVIVRRPHPAG